MPRIRLLGSHDTGVEVRTRWPGDPGMRCHSFLRGINGLTQVGWVVGCDGWVRTGDDYLLVWRIPQQRVQLTACSGCALMGYPALVEAD